MIKNIIIKNIKPLHNLNQIYKIYMLCDLIFLYIIQMSTINVPIYNIRPATQIVDIINGNATICIVNPWFNLPGVETVDYNSFMAIKTTTTGMTCSTVTSPKIAVNLQVLYPNNYQQPTFTTNVLFTQDTGDKKPTTRLNFYPPFANGEINYQKVMGKYSARRGKIRQTGLNVEAVINYQLSQAFEFLYIAKLLEITSFSFENDSQFIAYVSKALSLSGDIQNDLNDYVLFNANTSITSAENPNPNDIYYEQGVNPRFVTKYAEKTGKTQDSSIDLFGLLNGALQNNYKKFNNGKIKLSPSSQAYYSILNTINYAGMSPAVYNKGYKVALKDNQNPTIGTHVLTDYTLILNGDTVHTQKLVKNERTNLTEWKPMTVNDIKQIENVNVDAKVFVQISFDMRAYSTKIRSPVAIRYLIKNIAYKNAPASSGLNVDINEIEFDFDGGDVDISNVQANTEEQFD